MGVATLVVGNPVWVPNDDGTYVAAVVKRLEEGGAVLVAKPAARGLADLKVLASTAVPMESGCSLVPKRLANTVKGQWRVVLDRKVNVEETNKKVGEIWNLQLVQQKKCYPASQTLKIMSEYIISLQDLKALSITLDKQEVENYVNGATELDEDIDASRRKSYQAFLSEFDDSEDEGVDKDEGSGDEWGPDDSVKVNPFSNQFQISFKYLVLTLQGYYEKFKVVTGSMEVRINL